MVFLCATAEVPANKIKRVEVKGLPPLAVYHVKDGFFVTDDTCTHGEASLSEGEIIEDGRCVECPFHQGCFEIASGEPTAAPCNMAIRSYKVTVKDGGVHIEP